MPTSRRSRRAAAARSTSSCRRASSPPSAGASIARSPMGRCSTCSCSTCAAIADRTAAASESRGDAAFLGPAQVAWLKRELAASRATWKVIAADLPIGLINYDAAAQGDGAAARARARDRRPAALHQACGRAQHRVDHRRHALHGGASLRSEPRGVPGLRAVLGIHVGPDPCRHRRAGAARQHVRAARGLSQGLQQGAGRRSRALLRPAVLRPCGDRRRERR